MKNTIKTILCVQITAMFLTAALAGPVAPGEKVPFKGSLQGAATIAPLAPPLISVVIEGTGNATHLGRFTVDLLEVVNVTASTGVGSFVFTAANGDTLTADFTGVASLTE